MDKKIYTYMALCTLFMLQGCSQDAPGTGVPSTATNRIYFRSYLPSISQTRADVISMDNFHSAQVTCINPDDTDKINTETGAIDAYFENIPFEKGERGLFFSQGDNVCRWPDTESTLHFFAFYPATDIMQHTTGEEYYQMVNDTRKNGTSTTFDYRIDKFRIAEDIAEQVDFLAAYTTGTLTKDSETGLDLNFKHHLARIEISAWGENEKYDFEIAGIRIGNVLVEGDFDFTTLMSKSTVASPWKNTGLQAPIQHIYGPGESIVRLSKDFGMHSTEGTAASIMGTGGAAMVIPMTERIKEWGGKEEPSTSPDKYTTDKMYFSVLLRVINKAGEVAYPYPNDKDDMKVIYLAIDNEGKVTDRLYKDDDEFYTSSEKSEETIYTPTDDETICTFGWAAIPLPANWEAGKIYTYNLNYSQGIGWHDPSDPNPGEPIIERGQIPFNVTVEEWAQATDYDSNIEVPKREPK